MAGDDEPTIDTIISELREAYEAATPGNWAIHSDDFDTAIRGPKSGPGWYEPITDSIGDKDAELIVKAHNYLPRLLDELELTESYRRAAGSLFDDEHLQSETAHVHMRREAERENKRLARFEAVDPIATCSHDCGFCQPEVWCVGCVYDETHDALCPWAGAGG